ncbi:10207_t:CDS:2 [Racocetra persica]|uniref:10207_t:CDS:1 n=1 Tax=Racocetra persica TaxID=160502 RepID=A0ACA9KNT8_9GLOM|nr:10207_t:CDS:2 [Racocetra persica]
MSDKYKKNNHNLLNETEEIANETEINLESFFEEIYRFKIRIDQNSAIDNTKEEKVQYKRTICCHHSGQYYLANKAKLGNIVRQGC